MRIAIIVPGGVGSGLHGQGIPILVDWIERVAHYHDVSVFSLVQLNLDYNPSDYQLYGTNLQYYDSVFKKLTQTYQLIAKAHQKKSFDIFQGIWPFPSGFLATRLAKRYKKKSIISLQGGGLVSLKKIGYGGNRTFLHRTINNWSIAAADKITVISNFQKKLLPKTAHLDKTLCIPYGVDMDRFTFQKKAIQNPIKFIHIANLNNVKNQETLVRAFHIIQQKVEAQLTIVGPDYYEGRIQKLCSDLNLNTTVKFMGFQSYEKIPYFLNQSDILLHSSYHEGMPLTAVEAFASGVLVCGTHVGILHDLAKQCCLTVPIEDFKGLANKVLTLIDDKSLQATLQTNAYNWAKNHTLDWTVQQFNQLYSSLKI